MEVGRRLNSSPGLSYGKILCGKDRGWTNYIDMAHVKPFQEDHTQIVTRGGTKIIVELMPSFG
jgi:hypothetical protein